MKSDFSEAIKFTGENAFKRSCEYALKQLEILNTGKGKGNDFLGWINLPQSYDTEDITDIITISETFRNLDAVVIIGIGGSYLGAKAVIEALKPHFYKTEPEIIFAGHNLNGNYHSELIEYLHDKQFGIVVISKSGTTTEPAVAFRLLYNEMKKRFDKETIKKRIIAITDAEKGALRQLADKEGFTDFIIADNVGGRFSVLSPVGLIPIAVAGFDIDEFLRGASIAQDICLELSQENPAIKYAAIRNLLYASGHKVELMVNYNMRLNYFTEWWKQLYGESEGKENKGIFPASVSFTTDLHSLGQYIQQGERQIFETVIFVNDTSDAPIIPADEENLDKLNYIAGKDMEFVNRKAFEGTLMAHVDGQVPNILFEIDNLDEYNLGFMMYFFEIACGISGYMLGVNPFDQPGVEDYKKNMFKLLGK
ncbi:MAG TPA: glucose-6-phosphate isomerase [Bacteroidales bacterium]|nr:glucose-6-phosphate isomerase [Bacteroidales bacterium]